MCYWRDWLVSWLTTHQGGAEAERFPRGDVPLAVVEEELTEQPKKNELAITDK